GALVGGVLYWRAQQAASAAPEVVPAPVAKGNLDINVESSGKVEAARSVPGSVDAAGQVSEVLVKEGERVAKGQPLARVDDIELRLQVEQAEADPRSAQAKPAKLKAGSTPADVPS